MIRDGTGPVPWYYLDTDGSLPTMTAAEGCTRSTLAPPTTPVFYLNVDELGELSLIDNVSERE